MEDLLTLFNQETNLQRYKQGYTFNLEDHIGVVVDGVVAVETVANSKKAAQTQMPTTVRLTGSGSFLNLDQLVNPVAATSRQYVVESQEATLGLVRLSTLKARLEFGCEKERLKAYLEVVEHLVQQIHETTEVATWLGVNNAEERLIWALKRIQKHMPHASNHINRHRMASYIGTTLTTVSRILSRMRKEGRLSKYGKTAICSRRRA